MKQEKAERFIAVATQMAEAFVGLAEMLEEFDDDEIQGLTEFAAELRAASPEDVVIQTLADAVNDEYGRRLNAAPVKTAHETWIEF